MEPLFTAKGRSVLALLATIVLSSQAFAQDRTESLESRLLREDMVELAQAARKQGDPVRGALLFHQPQLSCTKCHSAGDSPSPLGPDLSKPEASVTDVYLIESLLSPSKVIRKGYSTETITRTDGKSISGLVIEDRDKAIVIRDPAGSGEAIVVAKSDIDDRRVEKLSLMPMGLVNLLPDRQQFLDLASYLIEIAEFGPARARSLRPDPSVINPPLPEYEKDLDHAGLIAGLDEGARRRGEAVYARLCVTCHGTRTQPGSMPTSLPFATGKFKNGNDPHAMYQTLTRGYGLMPRQPSLVPRQKYEVIHYIRETYLKPFNDSQYFKVDQAYLNRLPKGKSRGPAPSPGQPWITADYGRTLSGTIEVGSGGGNIAYKGIAVRLDPGEGGVARGKAWMLYEHDTMRVAAGWMGEGFIDWNGINFDGQHQVHPHVVGQVAFQTASLPGWADPATDKFGDPRLKGLDGKPYGPLPREWARYRGLYHHGDRAILSYTLGRTPILESPGMAGTDSAPVFTRSFEIGPHDRDLILQVAATPKIESGRSSASKPMTIGSDIRRIEFKGSTSLNVTSPERFDLTNKDYSIAARIKTTRGGTIFAQAPASGKWAPDGKALFVRGGRLVFDIGWVGAVESRSRITDGKWHDVAMTWERSTGTARLFIDGKADGEGVLKPKAPAKGMAVRIGFASPDFPRGQSFFDGEIAEVRFYSRRLNREETTSGRFPTNDRVASWNITEAKGRTVSDSSGHKHDASASSSGFTAGLVDSPEGCEWLTADGALRLRIPADMNSRRFTLWMTSSNSAEIARSMAAQKPLDLESLTHGGPARWKETLTTRVEVGKSDGPFEADALTAPANNPWRCQIRASGLDFVSQGKELALCTWDGDVWRVSGLDRPDGTLSWRRIASGLFQPLGLKVIDQQIHVCCRDQIVILRDLNDDGETDYYECFNSDHQVTEHFHEFAMGLQTDSDGNFYYAKAARHAKTPLVPQHGTLLRVSRDGSKTDILANGFRAPNGVCVNNDGTFFLTDQEGHWMPKNRINWVRKGGFYGNMYSPHGSDDPSDKAMQEPLCWITNRFDRSPGELVRIEAKQWGATNGSLLNLSYGMGKLFIVPHEKLTDGMQGGMVALPLPAFPTGLMRGRFHPRTGDLYACGMFAWAGNQQEPGGLYRIRPTGRPAHLPIGFRAAKQSITLEFSDPLHPDSVTDVRNFGLKVWDLRRSANYGSPHLNERALKVTRAALSANGRTLSLTIPELAPTRGLEMWYSVKGTNGREVDGLLHGSIYELRD